MLVPLTCSPLPRPSVQKGAKGHQWWKKDVFHVAAGGKTLCGVNASGWLAIDSRNRGDTLSDPHLCSRCARKLRLDEAVA